MNREQFNEKYKDYLADRFYGLAIDDNDVIEFLDKIFETVLTKVPNFQYFQIKLKFGVCSCYLNDDLYLIGVMIEDRINKILKSKKQ